MGVFSYIDLEMDCPFCKRGPVKEFQSKDGMAMEHHKPWEVNRFYSVCPFCNKWIEYIRKGSSELEWPIKHDINLIGEGHSAVKLLRKLMSQIDYIEDKNKIPNPIISEISKFLSTTNYPADDNNWMEWYTLRDLEGI